jgi:hypothetical protein
MPDANAPRRRFGAANTAVAAAAVILALGGLALFVPYLLLQRHRPLASVADAQTSTERFSSTAFVLPARQRACMDNVTVTPDSSFVRFQARPAPSQASSAGPPLDIVVSAAGYHASAMLEGGYRKATVAYLNRRPRHALIGTACFANLGTTTALLYGTAELRAISRSNLTIDGRPVVGNISLRFYGARPQARFKELGDVFSHISNLTDLLIPSWLVGAILVLAVLAIPAGIVAAFYGALRGGEA